MRTVYDTDNMYTRQCSIDGEDVLFGVWKTFVMWLVARYLVNLVYPSRARMIMSCTCVLTLFMSSDNRYIDWVHICSALSSNTNTPRGLTLPYIDTTAVAYSASSAAFALGGGYMVESMIHMVNTVSSLWYAHHTYARSRPMCDIVGTTLLLWEISVHDRHDSHYQRMFLFGSSMVFTGFIVPIVSGDVAACFDWCMLFHTSLHCVQLYRSYDRTLYI
jgi:hypothetical protein